ncbi:MAG TPA: hypothetical protein VGP72_09395 [Planctomycetota bacterium]|jgi:hypothetical protein
MSLTLRALLLLLACTTVSLCAAADAQDTKPAHPWPLWDGKETIADYARRAGLEPTKTLDLGGGVTLDPKQARPQHLKSVAPCIDVGA